MGVFRRDTDHSKKCKRIGERTQPRIRLGQCSAEKKNTIDVLVTGDSESYTSVSPMDLWDRAGIAAYDCGQPGQRIQETYYILKTAFRTQSPKLVLFETNTMFRDPGFLKNVQLSLTEPLAYHFPVIKYHNAPKKSYKGFEIRDKVVSYEGDKEYMKETKDKAQIPEVVRIYMEKIKRLCEKNGADLLLVSAPSPKNYNYKKHNSLEEYARENDLPYVDLNMKFRDIGIDWKMDSYDRGDHLNISGARKVTAYIGGMTTDGGSGMIWPGSILRNFNWRWHFYRTPYLLFWLQKKDKGAVNHERIQYR